MQTYAAFRSKPTIDLGRKLQKLAANSLNPSEILGADVASIIFADRSSFSVLLSKRVAESKRNYAIVQAALSLINRNHRGRLYEGFSPSGYSLGYVETYELDESVLVSCPRWVQASAIAQGYGRPVFMRKLSRVSASLAERSETQPKVLLLCAQELGAFGYLSRLNGPMGPPAFSAAERNVRQSKRLAMFNRILELDPNCDIALWTVGLYKYLDGHKEEGRSMILKAYPLLKKRPNAKDFADLVRDWLAKFSSDHRLTRCQLL
jgi:hypothetical protein